MRPAHVAAVAALFMASTATAIDPAALPAQLMPPIPRVPIDIDGDADLCGDPLSGVVNCALADGTADRPYVIAWWAIETSATFGVPAVSIANTTKHLVVRLNAFTTAAESDLPVVVLTDAANVVLERNVVTAGLGPGLVADGLIDATITGNVLRALGASATAPLVSVADSPGVRVLDNSFAAIDSSDPHGGDFLAISRSANAVLDDNGYASARGTAVVLTDSPAARVTSETMEDVMRGIALERSADATATELVMTGVASGIVATASGTLTLSASRIEDDFPCEPTCAWVDGVRLVATSLTARNVTIEDFENGVYVDAPFGRLDAKYLNLTGNAVGVLAVETHKASVTWSNVAGNEAGIVNLDRDDDDGRVNAENVWWGCVTGPNTAGCDSTFGRVTVTPFRTTPVQ